MARPKKYHSQAERDEARKAAQLKYYHTKKGRKGHESSMDTYLNTWKGRAANRLASIRNRCKTAGLEYDLDAEWYIEQIKGKCALSGLAFIHCKETPGKKKIYKAILSPSVDRVNPTKGYTKDNCRVILNCLNRFKGTMKDKQMLEIALQTVGFNS